MSRPSSRRPSPLRRRGVMTERWGWQPLAWEQDGLPTWRYGFAPRGLLTRRQMRAVGLAPGGAAPVAQVVVRMALRYRAETRARLCPRGPRHQAHPEPAQLVALGRALAARRWCPSCARDVGYCLPTSLGACVTCAFPDPDQHDRQHDDEHDDRHDEQDGETEVDGDDLAVAA